MKDDEKQKAILLRQRGYSYNQILREIAVSKSTLSLWLRDVQLSDSQTKDIRRRQISGAITGGQKRRAQRIQKVAKIKSEAIEEVGRISQRELWLIGISLYWAEGTKEKIGGKSQQLEFANSDPDMLQLFLRWLIECCEVEEGRISYRLHIHQDINREKATEQWVKELSISPEKFKAPSIKKHERTGAKTRDNYKGLITIRVSKSSDITRKIAGWVEGITNFCNS